MSTDFYTSSILPYAPIIIKICRAYTDTQEDFEDYYQEVCLQIWRSKDNFRKEAEWSTWIYREDVRSVYGGLMRRLEELLSDMEELKNKKGKKKQDLGFHIILGFYGYKSKKLDPHNFLWFNGLFKKAFNPKVKDQSLRCRQSVFFP